MKRLLFIFIFLPLFANSQVMVGNSINCDTLLIQNRDTVICDTTFYIIKKVDKEIAGFDSPNLALILKIDGDIIVLGGLVKNGVYIGGYGRYFWYTGEKKNLPFSDLTEEEIKKLREL